MYKLKIQMNVHSSPNMFSDVNDILPAGTVVDVIETNGIWCRIYNGWIMSTFLEVV